MTMEKFHYTLPDGHKITLPKMENMPMGVIRKTRKLSQADQVFTMLEMILPESDMEHTDTMVRGEFNDLMTAWKAESETELGESSAS